jgi:hypothetical protein
MSTFFKTRPGDESFCGILESFEVANDGVLWCIDYRRVGVGDVHSIQENEAAKMQIWKYFSEVESGQGCEVCSS